VRGDHAPHVGRGQAEQLRVCDRLDAGRAGAAVEHRELAEEVAGAERGEGDRAPVGVLAGDPEIALADDVAGVRGVALVKHPHALGKRTRDRDVGDALKLVARELREQRNPSQEL
jgi:hypothetical protein